MLALYSISIPDTLVFRSRKPNHPFTMECNLVFRADGTNLHE
jgi:hypothetical protein